MLITQEVEAGGSGVQDHSQLHTVWGQPGIHKTRSQKSGSEVQSTCSSCKGPGSVPSTYTGQLTTSCNSSSNSLLATKNSCTLMIQYIHLDTYTYNKKGLKEGKCWKVECSLHSSRGFKFGSNGVSSSSGSSALFSPPQAPSTHGKYIHKFRQTDMHE